MEQELMHEGTCRQCSQACRGRSTPDTTPFALLYVQGAVGILPGGLQLLISNGRGLGGASPGWHTCAGPGALREWMARCHSWPGTGRSPRWARSWPGAGAYPQSVIPTHSHWGPQPVP